MRPSAHIILKDTVLIEKYVIIGKKNLDPTISRLVQQAWFITGLSCQDRGSA